MTAKRIDAAVSSGFIMVDCWMLSSVRPWPMAKSDLMPPGQSTRDLDAEGMELFGECLAEAYLGELAGAVDAFIGNTGKAGDGGDEDDAARTLLQKAGRTACEKTKPERRLVCIMVSNSSSVVSEKGL